MTLDPKKAQFHFDVQKSLEMCKPNYYPEGVVFVKRILIKRSKVNWSMVQQYRANINDLQNRKAIADSLKTFGYIYTSRPQVVYASPVNDSMHEFYGHSGFNRDGAMEDIGSDYTIVDVVKFVPVTLDDGTIKSAEQVKLEYGYMTNHNFTPSAGNVDNDLIRGLRIAVLGDPKNNVNPIIDRADSKKLKAYLDIIAADKTPQYRTKIYNRFRREHGCFENMRPLSGPIASKWLKVNGYPYQGDGGKKTASLGLGYAVSDSVSKTFFWNSLKLSRQYDNSQVMCYGFISDPNPKTLVADRKTLYKDYCEMIDFYHEIVSFESGVPLDEIVKNSNCPFTFGGFIPQNITPQEGGAPKENDIVDVNGKHLPKQPAPFEKHGDINDLQYYGLYQNKKVS